MFKPKGGDIHVESRARDQARWMIRDHGDEAEEVMRAKLNRARVTEADRYRYKLTLKEIARLRRTDPEKYGQGKSAGLLGSLMGLFG